MVSLCSYLFVLAMEIKVCMLYVADEDRVAVRLMTEKEYGFWNDFVSWTRHGQSLFGPKNIYGYSTTDEREFGQGAIERYTGSRIINKIKKCDSNQWTTKFGELGVQMMLETILGRKLSTQVRFGSYRPDLYDPDTDTCYEVKTQTFSVSGTAGHKIFAVPHMYQELGKKIVLVLVGSLETNPKYKGLIHPKTQYNKKSIDFFHSCNTHVKGVLQLIS